VTRGSFKALIDGTQRVQMRRIGYGVSNAECPVCTMRITAPDRLHHETRKESALTSAVIATLCGGFW